jgi:hypothetical protein
VSVWYFLPGASHLHEYPGLDLNQARQLLLFQGYMPRHTRLRLDCKRFANAATIRGSPGRFPLLSE